MDIKQLVGYTNSIVGSLRWVTVDEHQKQRRSTGFEGLFWNTNIMDTDESAERELT
jgi:hypothetical protein